MTRATSRPTIVAGKKAVLDKIPGVNRVTARLASGKEVTYYYHRATGTKLPGAYGSPEFLDALAAARAGSPKRDAGTLSGLIRDFEQTAKWRKLRESTKGEYRRVFKFWDGKFGNLPLRLLEARGFRQDVLEWHDEFSATKPREADNRVTILARVLSWAAKDRSLRANVLNGFDRAYAGDRSAMIWLPEQIEAFMAVARPAMQIAMTLALHTGQRHADIRTMAWSNYDGRAIRVRQEKTGQMVRVPCTKALKATLDALPRTGVLILTTPTGKAYTKRYLSQHWEEDAKLAGVDKLHFHDLRGTAITMLAEAGCEIGEIVAVSGHRLKSAQTILERYLARTSYMADRAIIKLENRMEQERAKWPAKWQGGTEAK